jgi:hypothetical protein
MSLSDVAPPAALDMRAGAVGTVIARNLIPAPCNVWSPHEAGRVRQAKAEKAVPVQCNRPSGHGGNHMCLTGSFERLAEWEPAKVVK